MSFSAHRSVGKSGLRVSSYGIAVWQNMSSKIGEDLAESIIQTAYEKVGAGAGECVVTTRCGCVAVFETGNSLSNELQQKVCPMSRLATDRLKSQP